MTLDPPTLLLALLLGFLLLALELGLAQRALARQVELRTWALGTWVLLAGFGAFALRPVLPGHVGLFVSNALILAGMALYAQALYRFVVDRALPRWVWAQLGAALLALAALLPWPQALRSSAVSLLYAAMLVPSIAVVVRHGWHAEPSLRTVALTMALACAALVVRGAHAWLDPAHYGTLLQASLGQGLTFLLCFLAVLGAGFGFVLASFQRVAHRMELLATRDGLTGCLNRSATEALIDHELRRGLRERKPVALVLFDIDHFKDVNDRHGHRTGDRVLAAFADAVRSRLRKSDVFGRVGGEEFALLLPDTDAEGARHLAEEVRSVVQQTEVDAGGTHSVRITLSGGVAASDPERECAAEQLYELADEALYRAKRLGRNRIEGRATARAEALPA